MPMTADDSFVCKKTVFCHGKRVEPAGLAPLKRCCLPPIWMSGKVAITKIMIRHPVIGHNRNPCVHKNIVLRFIIVNQMLILQSAVTNGHWCGGKRPQCGASAASLS